MDSYRLKSKIAVEDKEFLVQTVNDDENQAVVSSLFVDGEILEVYRMPHSSEISDDQIADMVKSTHEEKKNELEHLLATFKKVRESGDADLMYHLGTAFHYKRMYPEAEALFQSALDLSVEHHQAADCLGLVLLERGKPKDAVKAMAKAVELRPGYADYHNHYGEALLEADFCRRAVEEFETALKLNVYYADAYLNLGIAYLANAIKREDFEMYENLLEKTGDTFNKAVLISQELKSDQFQEAFEILRQGDLNRALSLFKVVRRQRRELSRRAFSGYYLRFLLQFDWANKGAVENRIRFLKEEIEKNPNYVDLHHELALCYLHRAHLAWQKGINHFQKAVELNPKLGKTEQGLELALKFNDDLRSVLGEIARAGGND